MSSRVLEEIAQAIGMPATIELTRAYGGRTLHVPKTLPALHPLVLAVGGEAAAVLSREFAGMAIEVPAERQALVAARNRTIAQEYQDGKSVKRLARDWVLSRKMIHKILEAEGVCRR